MLRTLPAVLALALGGLPGLGQLPRSEPEYAVKAKIIRYLSDYSTWPPRPGERPDSPLLIGVLGLSPFEGALEVVFDRARIQGRPAQVRYYRRAQDALEEAHVLFLSSSLELRLKDILETLRGHPILTVGDTPGFAERGVMVNLLAQGQGLKLEVNLTAVRGAGLTLSGQVLKHARIIEGS